MRYLSSQAAQNVVVTPEIIATESIIKIHTTAKWACVGR